jgi:hypothetical protein
MNLDGRKKLLQHFAELATEADVAYSPRVFLPLPRHRLALRTDVAVILGARGAGKTAMFRIVNALGPKLRELYRDRQIPEARWVDCFSEGPRHPDASVLDSLSTQFSRDPPLRAFWMAHLLGRLAEEGVPGARLPNELLRLRQNAETNPALWTPWAESNPAAIMGVLDAVEHALAASKRTVFATYDALDALGRLGELERVHRQRLVRTLLALWLSLSNRYRHLRAKIFLRHDLFEEAESGFADASKLRSRAIGLDWDVESLYRMAVRHLANHGPYRKAARDWLAPIEGLSLEDHDEFGFMPSAMDEAARRGFATALAGEVMGAGVKKGYTHRWIPDRLQDADGRIVPRSMLRLLGEAAKRAQLDPLGKGRQLMRPIDLSAALIETSKRRARELGEEYSVVQRLERLRGTTMLLEHEQVVRLLAQPVDDADRLPKNGEFILDELRRIGVLEVRADGRIDVPDIYRYGYGIKRKGGVRRPK